MTLRAEAIRFDLLERELLTKVSWRERARGDARPRDQWVRTLTALADHDAADSTSCWKCG